MKKPNILIIMSDEQRRDSGAKTPHIDRLAAEGMKTDRCFTPYPLCCPARTSLWTSLLPHRHHVMGNWRLADPEGIRKSPVHSFREQGYHTFYSGKWHVPGAVPEDLGFADRSAIPAVIKGCDKGRYIEEYREYARSKGYEIVSGNNENLTRRDLETSRGDGPVKHGTSSVYIADYLETWQTDRFLETLERSPSDKPFFGVVSYSAPHFPMVVPEPYASMYNPEKIDLPDNFLAGLEGKPQEVHDSQARAVCRNLTEREWREIIALYRGFCTLIDDKVGRIITDLKARELYDDTLILFTSDHGDMMGSHGLFMKKYECHYDEVTNVPFVVKPANGRPLTPGDASPNGLISLTDILPTLSEYTGVALDGCRYDGISFAGGAGRDYVISETFRFDGNESGCGDRKRPENLDSSRRDGMNISVRTATEKTIFHWEGDNEYYNLSRDPLENENLAGKPESQGAMNRHKKLILEALSGNPALAEMWAAINS